MWWTENLTYYW